MVGVVDVGIGQYGFDESFVLATFASLISITPPIQASKA
jgi:hypothetical protein